MKMKFRHNMKKEETKKDENLEQQNSNIDESQRVDDIADQTLNTEATDNLADEPQQQQNDDNTLLKLQEMESRYNEVQEKYLRTYAEYENYRKRTGAEKLELQLSGNREMAKAILPIVDDMERALAATENGDSTLEGFKLIYDKTLSILSQKGIKQMECIGQIFNPEIHEAVTKIPAPTEEEKNKIIAEEQKGYYINDKILRYPKVVVAI